MLKTAILTAAFTLMFSGALLAKSTHPNPPKVKKVDELRIFPSSEVPQNPERYIFKVKNTINGVQIGQGGVAVYGFDNSGYRLRIGTIPEDTEIKIEGFRKGGSQHYYAFKFKGTILKGPSKGKITRYGWIPGSQLYVAGYSSGAK